MTEAPIIFLLKGYPRLSETFIAQEILGLEQLGLPVRIVAMRRPTDDRIHPIHREIKAPVSYLPEYLHHEPIRVLRAAWAGLRRRRFAAAWRAVRADFARDISRNRLRRFGQALVLVHEMPDDTKHIHAHFIHTPASVARYASLLTGVRWTLSAHAKDIWTSADWDLKDKLHESDWAVTCTASGKERLDRLGPAQRPVHLQYHGLDLQRFQPLTAPRPARNGVSARACVQLLTVGRAVPKKGLDILLDALALLPPDLNWRWTHIGGGTELGKLKKRALALKIEQNLVWLGAQDQQAVLQHYRDADIFVLPCRIAKNGDRDGLPNVLMEAQSQGLACISSPISGIPELIADRETGLLVQPEDAGALSDAITSLIRDPDLRHRLGRAGQQRVRQMFDHKAGIQALYRMFEPDLARLEDVQS
ncbi:glycosyltransferase family 4 protein [Methylovirgula sp. 4M-Z18]|uniref:glycosyltransferase family 4 protein n=1 Tax=Methylovirgula sp. 4M-Z18 TaxID=2293567 RepID=UPI000E2FD49D|nr:glycosyltransferase family 4 protein [Methylovirgula sp. 4M-Z18]RFB79662.1 colanic acid biosynthesis glycosyltransferase WcaL [Methylovirgula sp. 4M-Z18]